MSALTVRGMRPDDVPVVRGLLLQLAEYERMTQYVTGDEAMLREALFGRTPVVEGLIAEHEREPVGYALFYPTFHSFSCTRGVWLEDLFVAPAARGTGAGRRLMAELARLALSRGQTRLRWDVLDWNTPAIGFYEHCGAEHHAADWLEYGLERAGLERLAAESR